MVIGFNWTTIGIFYFAARIIVATKFVTDTWLKPVSSVEDRDLWARLPHYSTIEREYFVTHL